MAKITTNDILELTGKDGTFFNVGFHKRPKKLGKRALERGEVQPTRGEFREFKNCRFGVRRHLKGEGPKYDREAKNLLCVYVLRAGLKPEDAAELPIEQSGDYRTIPCENVEFVHAHGKKWVVEGGVLVESAE